MQYAYRLPLLLLICVQPLRTLKCPFVQHLSGTVRRLMCNAEPLAERFCDIYCAVPARSDELYQDGCVVDFRDLHVQGSKDSAADNLLIAGEKLIPFGSGSQVVRESMM